MDHKMELLSRKFHGMPLLCVLCAEAVRVFFNFAPHCCCGRAHDGSLITQVTHVFHAYFSVVIAVPKVHWNGVYVCPNNITHCRVGE